jgi:Fe2+ transport system protein B
MELSDALCIPTTPTVSKTTKTTKKLRKAILKSLLTTKGKINRIELLEQFQCSDRSLRNDMNEVAEEIEAEQSNKMKILRGLCTDKLTIKAAVDELDESTMAKIALSGEVHKELSIHKEDITITNNRTFNLTSYSEEDKTAILDAYRRLNKRNSGASEPNSIH